MSMLYAVRQVMEQHATTWNTVPAIVTAKSELDANIASLEGALTVQLRDITGHTEAKAVARKAMEDRTIFVAGGVMAFAVATGDEGLAEEMNIFPSELAKIRDSEVAQRCQHVLDAANTNAASVADYGIGAAEIAALQTALDEYKVLVQQPRNVISARKSAGTEIAMLVRDSMKLLTRRMDMLMRRYMSAAPELHRQYTNARIIIDRGAQGKEVVVAA